MAAKASNTSVLSFTTKNQEAAAIDPAAIVYVHAHSAKHVAIGTSAGVVHVQGTLTDVLARIGWTAVAQVSEENA